MRDVATPVATRIRARLTQLVSDGIAFCPLSYGVISELFRQETVSRFKTAALMEGLSLNVSHAFNDEVFTWEVEQYIRRAVGGGAIDLSLSGVYVPIYVYTSSKAFLRVRDTMQPQEAEDLANNVRTDLAAVTLTKLLSMIGEWGFHYHRSLCPPRMSDVTKEIWATTNGNRKRTARNEALCIHEQVIMPVVKKLPPDVEFRFMKFVEAVPKDEYGDCLSVILAAMPALRNDLDLNVAFSQEPNRKDKINDVYDMHILPVPLAYACAFVSLDGPMAAMARNRTQILQRTECRFLTNLDEFDEWLNTEMR